MMQAPQDLTARRLCKPIRQASAVPAGCRCSESPAGNGVKDQGDAQVTLIG